MAAAAFGSVSCNADKASRRYVEQGNRYFQERKYREAALQYRNAIKKNSKSGEAYYRLGLAESNSGRLDRAVAAFRRAIALSPENNDAKARLADVYLAVYVASAEKNKELLEYIKPLAAQLEAKDKSGFDTLRLRGYIATAEGRTAEGIALLRQADSVKPVQQDVVLTLTDALFKAGENAEAEKLARDYLAKRPADPAMYDLLYGRYILAKRFAEAEKVLQNKAAINPGVALYRLQLATHHLSVGRPEDMRADLQYLLDRPGEFPEARLQVGDFYMRTGKPDEAIRQYQAGMQERPTEAKRWQMLIVDALVAQGKKQDAEAVLDAILRQEPDDKPARAMRAKLLVTSPTKERVESGLQELRALVEQTPDSSVLRFNLGAAYLANQDVEAAREQFRNAVKRDPAFLPPKIALAQTSIDAAQYREALQYANDALALNSTHPAARLVRGAALVGVGNYAEARTVLTDLLRDAPDYRDAQLQFALLHIGESRFDEAEALLRKLYRFGQEDLRPLLGLVDVTIVKGKPEQAFKLIQDELGRNGASIPLRSKLAETAVRAGKADLALEQYRWLASAYPTNPEFPYRVGEIQYASGDIEGAIRSVKQSRDLAPQNPAISLVLGALVEYAGRSAEAREYYKVTLQAQPENVVALNNMAYNLAESGGDLSQATTMIEKAAKLAPQNPNINDTLGWIYLKKRRTDVALRVFDNLVRKYPDTSTFHYHYGVALRESGNKAQARSEFQTALSKKPPAGEEALIRQEIGRLGS